MIMGPYGGKSARTPSMGFPDSQNMSTLGAGDPQVPQMQSQAIGASSNPSSPFGGMVLDQRIPGFDMETSGKQPEVKIPNTGKTSKMPKDGTNQTDEAWDVSGDAVDNSPVYPTCNPLKACSQAA